MRHEVVLGLSVLAVLFFVTSGPVALAGDPVGPNLTIYQEDVDQSHAAVAYNWRHDEFLVVWENTRPGGVHDIYARRVSGAGSLLSQFAITGGDGVSRSSPDVAYDSEEDRYLVVFTREYSPTDTDIYGRFIPWAGPDSGLTEFSIDLSSMVDVDPHVAYGLGGTVGQQYLVVWEREGTTNSVEGCFVEGDGTGIGISWQISPAFPSHSPTLAYNITRNEFLVVWSMDWTMTDQDIAAVIVNASGAAVYGGWFGVTLTSGDDLKPVAAACPSADQYLVAFEYPGLYDIEIRAKQINGDATMPGGIIDIHDSTDDEESPSVSCVNKPGMYLVGWTQWVDPDFHSRGICSRAVDKTGHVGETIWVIGPSFGADSRISPDIAAGSSNFLVGWQHHRDFAYPHKDIHGSLVMPIVLIANFEGGNMAEWSASVH